MDTLKATAAFREHLTRFINYSDEEWELCKSYFEFTSFKKKAFFAEAGKVAHHIGYIYSGSVRVLHINDGVEITGYFCFENELVSSYKSFITRKPAQSYIQALEDTNLVLINYNNWQKMLEDRIIGYKTERLGRRIAEHYLCCYDDRMNAFITQSPEERYLQLLENGKDMLQRIPQHYIANFLGITPVSLSRIRRRILA